MTMTTFDNRAPLDGWRDPRTDPPRATPPRCCGTFCDSNVCTVCGNWVALGLGEN